MKKLLFIFMFSFLFAESQIQSYFIKVSLTDKIFVVKYVDNLKGSLNPFPVKNISIALPDGTIIKSNKASFNILTETLHLEFKHLRYKDKFYSASIMGEKIFINPVYLNKLINPCFGIDVEYHYFKNNLSFILVPREDQEISILLREE